MRALQILLRHAILSMSAVLVLHDYALAYIDPSTGSYIIQIILAGVLGALFAIKTYWGRIKLFFTKKKKVTNRDSD